MRKSAVTAALSALALVFSSFTALADYSLNILHINDWHSRIESINRFGSTCSKDDEAAEKCFGGAARLKTAIDGRRAAQSNSNILLLNAGDNFQGSLYYTTYKGAVEAEFLTLMKFDVLAVGNHEFDDGEAGLARFLDRVTFPVIGANVAAAAGSALKGRIGPYAVLEIGGERIGVIGAVANDTAQLSSPGKHVVFNDDVAAITAAAGKLSEQGVNKIIALTHVGYRRDVEAIARIPDIDVVVGGHSHSVLLTGDEDTAGPYPTMVSNPGGYQVPVVQAGSNGKYLGDLSIVFDDAGIVVSAAGKPVLLDSSVKPDSAVLARIAELAAPIDDLRARVVSASLSEIDGSYENCRVRECTMGNLVADAMLARVRDQGISIAVQNGGGLRSSIDAGDVTMGELLTVLPFQNTLSTFRLSGRDIVASLEQAVSQIESGKGRFPQVAGLRFRLDRKIAAGNGRVKSVETREDGGWIAINEDKLYGVVTNDFIRKGGDGYELFASNAVDAYDYGPGLEEVVADYLASNTPYSPVLDGRIIDVDAIPPVAKKPAPVAKVVAVTPEPVKIKKAKKPAATEPEVVSKPAKAAKTKKKPKASKRARVETRPVPKARPKRAAPKPLVHIVRRGETFWKIARKRYGDPTKWKIIRAANKKIRNNRLKPGTRLVLPPLK